MKNISQKTKKEILAWLACGAENIAVMTRQYLATALWSSNDESDENGGEPMDKNYSISDCTKETLVKAFKDCFEFAWRAREKIGHNWGGFSGDLGHNFWLTRNRHGAGFWDGGYEKELGKYLTDISHEFGEVDLYIGDNGKLYFSRN